MATSKTHAKVNRMHTVEDKYFKIKTKANGTGKAGAILALAISVVLMAFTFFSVIAEGLITGLGFFQYLVDGAFPNWFGLGQAWIPFAVLVIGSVIFIVSLLTFFMNLLYIMGNGEKMKLGAGITALLFTGILPGILVLAGKKVPMDKSISKEEYAEIEKIFNETIKEKALLHHFETTVQVAFEKELSTIRTPLHPKIVEEVLKLLSNKEIKALVKEATRTEKERIKLRKAQRGGLFQRIGDFVSDKYDNIAFYTKEKFDLYEDAIGSFYKDVVVATKKSYKDFTVKASKFVDEFKDLAKDKIGEYEGKIKNVVAKPVAAVKKAVDGVTEGIKSVGNVGEKIKDGVNKAKDAVGNVIGNARDSVNSFVNKAKDSVNSTMDNVRGQVQGAVNKAKDSVQGVVDKARETVQGAVDKTRDSINNVVNKAKDGLNNAVGSAKSAIGRVADDAKDIYGNASNSAKNATQSLGNKIEQTANDLGSVSFNVDVNKNSDDEDDN